MKNILKSCVCAQTPVFDKWWLLRSWFPGCLLGRASIVQNDMIQAGCIHACMIYSHFTRFLHCSILLPAFPPLSPALGGILEGTGKIMTVVQLSLTKLNLGCSENHSCVSL